MQNQADNNIIKTIIDEFADWVILRNKLDIRLATISLWLEINYPRLRFTDQQKQTVLVEYPKLIQVTEL